MKLRPITVMAVLMAVVVLVVGLMAWHHGSGSVAAGQPRELPIRAEVAAPAAAAMVPASTIDAGAVTYVAAPGLAALAGTAHAWRLDPTTVTPATVNRLADALGLSGPAVAQGDGWTVAGSDRRFLTVSRSQPAGPWTWTMTGVAVSTPMTCAVPMVRPSIGNDVPPLPDLPGSGSGGVCQPPVTTVPAPVADPPPGSAQAEARARSILGDAGYDLSGWTVTSVASSDGTQVTATPDLGGAALDAATWDPASVGVSLYVGAGGEVTSGSGSWAQPVQVDAYPLIGTAAGIEALNHGQGLPGVEPMVAASSGQSAPETATPTGSAGSNQTDGPTTTECLPPNGVTQPCVVPISPSPPPTVDCQTVSAMAGSCQPSIPSTTTSTTVTAPPTVTAPLTVTMAPRLVRIDRAELVLEPMGGTDGATWLIPAYRFTSSTTAGTWTVLAIDTKWFDPGAPTGTDTTASVGTGGESSGSPPASTVVSPPTTPSTTVGPIIMPPDRTAVPASSVPSAQPS